MRQIEKLLAVLGAGVCIGGAILFSETSIPPVSFARSGYVLWPSLQIYLVELGLLGCLGLMGLVANNTASKLPWRSLTWFAIGAIVQFMVLEIIAGGLLLTSAVLAFVVAALLTDHRERGRFGPHLGISAVAGILQGSIMLMAQVPELLPVI